MDDTALKVLTVIVLLSIPTVMFGGFSLLRLLIAERLNEFQIAYFRAGHAHAGVLLVMSLAALLVADRFELGVGLLWSVGILLIVGVLAQSGGMFVHMAVGRPGTWSWGNTLTVLGGVALAAALVVLAVGVIVS
jgi:hypothetical protein